MCTLLLLYFLPLLFTSSSSSLLLLFLSLPPSSSSSSSPPLPLPRITENILSELFRKYCEELEDVEEQEEEGKEEEEQEEGKEKEEEEEEGGKGKEEGVKEREKPWKSRLHNHDLWCHNYIETYIFSYICVFNFLYTCIYSAPSEDTTKCNFVCLLPFPEYNAQLVLGLGTNCSKWHQPYFAHSAGMTPIGICYG